MDKINIFPVLFFITLFLLSSCSSDDSEETITINNNSSSSGDSLSIESSGALTFKISWAKSSNAYSEVIISDKQNLPSNERGSYFLTNNNNGLHTLNCNYHGSTDSSSSSYTGSGSGANEFRCEGFGPSILSGQRAIKSRLVLDENTTFYITIPSPISGRI